MYIGLELQKGSEPSHVHPIVNAFRAELSTRSRRQNIPMSDVSMKWDDPSIKEHIRREKFRIESKKLV